MARVMKPYYVNARGERITVPSWYAEWQGADGKTHRKRVSRDKRLALAFLAARIDEVERQKAGLAPAPQSADARDLFGLLADYLALLTAEGTADEYRKGLNARVRAVLAACEWHSLSQVGPDRLTLFLGALVGKGRSPATANGYLRDTKGFIRWAAKRAKLANPLDDVKPLNEEVDRRRSKAILSDTELAALVVAAEKAPTRANTRISGRDRAWLYRVAAYTGLRSGELASLTPERFALAAVPPVVTVAAKSQKGRREEAVPIPPHLVKPLGKWLSGKPAGEPLWPGRWAAAKRQAKWFCRDMAAAGIASTATFHGLRRGYVTRLIRAGVDVDLVRRLARHRSLATTMKHYATAELADLADAAKRLKPLPRPVRKPAR